MEELIYIETLKAIAERETKEIMDDLILESQGIA